MLPQTHPNTPSEIMLQFLPVIALVLVIGIFSMLLFKIRYPFFESLIGVFNPYFWIIAWLVKWMLKRLRC